MLESVDETTDHRVAECRRGYRPACCRNVVTKQGSNNCLLQECNHLLFLECLYEGVVFTLHLILEPMAECLYEGVVFMHSASALGTNDRVFI